MSRSHEILLPASPCVGQGLPCGFFTQARPVLLRDAGRSLKTISVTSLLLRVFAKTGGAVLVLGIDTERGPRRVRQVWQAS